MIVDDWVKFICALESKYTELQNGMPKPFLMFTDELYDHITIYCVFCRETNKEGFYFKHFTEPERTLEFLKHFDRRTGHAEIIEILHPEKYTINHAMIEFATEKCKHLVPQLKQELKSKDLMKAKSLLLKHGIVAKEVENAIQSNNTLSIPENRETDKHHTETVQEDSILLTV